VLLFGAARGSLDALVDRVVERVPPAGGAELGVLVRAPSAKLASDVTELTVGQLRARGFRASRLDGTPTVAQARGLEQVIELELDAQKGQLRATGTVWAVPSRLWAPGGPLEARAHLYVEMPLDDELRAYLPTSPPPALAQTSTVPLGDVPLLALDVGDVDGDGRAEVVGATSREVIAWRLDGNRAVERWRMPIAPVNARPAPIRPRLDVVTVSVENGMVRAHASPFADGVKRTGSAVEITRGYTLPGLGAACELEPGFDRFVGDCAPGSLPSRFWSAVALRDGDHGPTAATAPPGVLSVHTAAGMLTARGAGAQVALLSPETVVTAEPSVPGEPDAIVMRAIKDGLPIVRRIDRLPGAVRALAAGDLDGDGRAEVVAAIRDDAARRTELWVVR